MVQGLGAHILCNDAQLVSNPHCDISEPCATLGEFLHLSGPQTPYLEKRDNGTNSPGFVCEVKREHM